MKRPQSEQTFRYPTFSVDDIFSDTPPMLGQLDLAKQFEENAERWNIQDEKKESLTQKQVQDLIDSILHLCFYGLERDEARSAFKSPDDGILYNCGDCVNAISRINMIVLAFLTARAQLSPKDFKRLKDVATVTCQALKEVGEMVPEYELEIAPPSKTWPINIERRKKDREKQRAAINRFPD